MSKRRGLNSVLLIANFLFLVGVFSMIQGLEPEQVVVEKELVNVTQETVSPDLSCPRPVYNGTVNVTSEFENIQNAELDTTTELIGDSLKIKGVDAYGELYGSSMAPGIMDGDKVFSKKFSEAFDLEEGMIVRYRNVDNEGFTIHRIVGNYQSQGYVVTSGDRSNSMEKVSLGRISHVVLGVVYN